MPPTELAIGFRANWDVENSWSRLTPVSIHAENTGTWDSAPTVPYFGGAGKIETSYSTFTSTNINWGYIFLAGAGQNGSMRCCIATRIEKLRVLTNRIGPFVFSGEEDDDTTPSIGIFLESVQSLGDPLVRLNTLSGDFSETLDLAPYKNEWLIFDFNSQRMGSAGGGNYSHFSFCDVYVVHGTRPRLLAHLEPSTNPWSGSFFMYTSALIGFVATNEQFDEYTFSVDEFGYQTGTQSGRDALFPRTRAGNRGYPVSARLERWDEVASAWKSAVSLDPKTIQEGTTVSFLANRVEKAAKLKITSPGPTTPTKSRDYLDEFRKIGTGPLYRLSIFAPDDDRPDPSTPSGWVGDPIYWSGVANSVDINDETGEVEIGAIGFTKLLSQWVSRRRDYERQTPKAILDDLVTSNFLATWPGTIALDTDTDSAVEWFRVNRYAFQQAPFRSTATFLSNFGGFLWGVSVSGYPHAKTPEFSISFRESKADAHETKPGGAGLGEGVGMVVDLQDPRVTVFRERYDDGDFLNTFDFLGEVAHSEVQSIVSGWDSTTMRDLYAMTTSAPENPVPTDFFVGWECVFRDRVLRQDDRYRPARREVIPGKSIGSIPTSLIRSRVGNAPGTAGVYTIVGFDPSQASGWADFSFHRLPVPTPHLPSSFQTATDAVRYELRNRNNRIERTIQDLDSVAARETLRRSIDENSVRGMLLAGSIALVRYWSERREAEKIRLRIEGLRTWPNGNPTPSKNRIVILDGNAKPTRFGTTGNGGSNWTWGDDERPAGNGRTVEIREVDLTLGDSGWDAVYSLGVTSKEIERIIGPRDLGVSPFGG